MMKVGDKISVSGYITKEKFIVGRTLAEAEKILGFHAGRFSHGVGIAVLMELPDMQHFQLAAYSNVAAQNYQTPSGLDLDKLKATAKATWATTGFERLIKVVPVLGHDCNMKPDIQYPPGQGAPQWVVDSKIPLRAWIGAVVSDYPNGRCVAASSLGGYR
jgi:hypothetical protein